MAKLTGKARAKARKMKNNSNKIKNPNIKNMFTMSPNQKAKLLAGFKPDVGLKLADPNTSVDYVYISVIELAESILHHQRAGQAVPVGVYNLPCQLGEDVHTEYFGTFDLNAKQNYQLADMIDAGAINIKMRVSVDPEQLQTGLSGESYLPCKVVELIENCTSQAGSELVHMTFAAGNMLTFKNKDIAAAIVEHQAA